MHDDAALRAFVAGLSRWLDPDVMAEPDAGANLTRELRAALDQCDPSKPWPNRIVPVPGYGDVLTGPRALGGDPEKPFVDIVAWTFDPLAADPWARTVSAVRDAYHEDAPLWLRVRVSPAGVRALEGFTSLRGDQHVMAERVDRLQASPPVRASGRLSLAAITRDDYYDRYRAVHDAFRVGDPVLGALVSISTHAALEVARAEGLLFDVDVDGAWAGLIAAKPGGFAGVAGYVMEEEILVSEHRGQGLGPVMQRAFVDRLDGSGGRYLVGTIDVANVASARTAERVGRREIARYIFH